MQAVTKPDRSRDTGRPWVRALPYAFGCTFIVLGLHFYWFGVANRYLTFLYEHLGAGPFDDVTLSRYWMAGLVASAVSAIPFTATLALERWWRGALPSDWWRVWVLAALPAGVGVLAITSFVGWPNLPLVTAGQCVASTLAGLALAIWMGTELVRRPVDSLWLCAFGTGLVPTLNFLRAVELPALGIGPGAPVVYAIALAAFVAGQLLLLVASALATRSKRPSPRPIEVLLSGLALSYVGMPLAHHLSTGYLSTGANFFAGNIWLQGVIVLLAGVQVATISPMRRFLQRVAK